MMIDDNEVPAQLTLEETGEGTELGCSIYNTFDGKEVVVLDLIEFLRLVHNQKEEPTEEEQLFKEHNIPDSFEKDSHLWSDYFHSCKVTGAYVEGVQYMEERLTLEEFEVLQKLAEWLFANNYGMGHGNYFERFIQFLKEKTNG